MLGDLHENYVLYNKRPLPEHSYRQIVVVEMEQFQVYIFGGDVIQRDPRFAADSQDAEVHFHPNLSSALDHAKQEVEKSIADGWTLLES